MRKSFWNEALIIKFSILIDLSLHIVSDANPCILVSNFNSELQCKIAKIFINHIDCGNDFSLASPKDQEQHILEPGVSYILSQIFHSFERNSLHRLQISMFFLCKINPLVLHFGLWQLASDLVHKYVISIVCKQEYWKKPSHTFQQLWLNLIQQLKYADLFVYVNLQTYRQVCDDEYILTLLITKAVWILFFSFIFSSLN